MEGISTAAVRPGQRPAEAAAQRSGPYRGVAVVTQRLVADDLIHLVEQGWVLGKEAPVPEDKEPEGSALGRPIARREVLDICNGPLDQGG